MPPHKPVDVLHPANLPPIYHIGPPLASGPLPSVLYFSLSGQESLELDPYNQPAVFLAEKGVRVFSLTLPEHHGTHPHPGSMQAWAAHATSGTDFIHEFIDNCIGCIDYLIEQKYASPDHLGAAGLSRGGFAAAHLAALDKRVKFVVGFSPLTRLGALKEFHTIQDTELCRTLSLQDIVPQLADTAVRFYIGNRDTCVGTSDCFEFIKSLTEAAYHNRHRSPPVELILYPSIGHKGHGTPPEVFHDGADWLAKKLD